MRDLTKQEAIKLHREMWQAMKEYFEETGVKDYVNERYYFKCRFTEEKGHDDLIFDCYLCEYAGQQAIKHDELCEKIGIANLGCSDICKYCPLNWCKDCNKQEECESDCRCQCKNEDAVSWQFSPLNAIINLEPKEDTDEN